MMLRSGRMAIGVRGTWGITAAALAALAVGSLPAPVAAQTGSFLAVLNEQNNDSNGDSQRTVTFFDSSNLAGGPIFSVFMGFEGTTSTNSVDGGQIDVNPANGDVYFMEFDDPGSPSPDTVNDFDLYRIDFSAVFNHWEANFKGKDVRTLGGALMVGGIAPTNGVAANPPGSIVNSTNLDYVTYGVTQANGSFDFRVNHSNTFVMPGAIAKIGEVKRNNSTNPSPFFPNSLNFIDDEHLIIIDDSSGPDSAESTATDHQYRIIERISTSPGMADDATVDFGDGGYNTGAAESWNSRRIGLVNLDFDGTGAPVGHSEPESSSYYASPGGVRGIWVSESDGGGDSIAFLELDASLNAVGYRPLSTTGNPTSFALDDDPLTSTGTNDGKSDNLFVDRDSGDLIIIESGFGDATPTEPGVLRLNINSYDNGSGQIDVGSWDPKILLNPMKTSGASPTGLVRGYWSAYDSAADKVYIVNPGSGSPEVPQFGADLWVIDLATGTTSSFLDLDDSISLFTSDAFGDKVVAFSLGSADDADFDGDDDVDGNDFLIWQRGLGVGTLLAQGDADGDMDVDGDDLAIWAAQFGAQGAAAAADAAPEPGTLSLALACAAALGGSRRGRRRAVR